MTKEQNQLVSIITPAFKSSMVISDTINSVISQTYQNWELIIVDDCSPEPDLTKKIVNEWSLIDARIRLVELSINAGPAMARNAALKQSKGRWIAFLDSDDLWLPKKLELSVKYALKNEAAFLFTAYRRMSYDGSYIGKVINVPSQISYHELLGNTIIATSTVLIDAYKISKIYMRSTYYDDYDCWLRILKSGTIGYGLNIDLMRYRVSPGSVSRNKFKSAYHVWRAYRDLEGISIFKSSYYFVQYALRGIIKSFFY